MRHVRLEGTGLLVSLAGCLLLPGCLLTAILETAIANVAEAFFVFGEY